MWLPLPSKIGDIESMINDYRPVARTTADELYAHFRDIVACHPDVLWRLCQKKAEEHNSSLEAK